MILYKKKKQQLLNDRLLRPDKASGVVRES
jgi:hypothetical protein